MKLTKIAKDTKARFARGYSSKSQRRAGALGALLVFLAILVNLVFPFNQLLPGSRLSPG
jgi:hypothetical protein